MHLGGSMKRQLKPLVVAVSGAIALSSGPVFSQDTQTAKNDVIEEVVTIGTRSIKPRSATDSTVPTMRSFKRNSVRLCFAVLEH